MSATRPSFRPSAMRRLGAAVCTLALAGLVVGLSAVPAFAATCSGDTTMTIDLASGESVALSLSGADDPRSIVVTPDDPSCAGFNTDTVTMMLINGTDGNESVTIDQTGSAPFPHQNTVSIDLALGGGTDALVITGQITADAIGLGANGISLDTGDTPDVTGLGSVETSTVNAGGGDDTVSGKEAGPGGDFPTAVTIDGDVGNDALTGGNGNDAISGGSGNDTLKGGSGGDVLDGGSGGDVVSGGGASDTVMGGAGSDRVKGGGDGDTLDGGAGEDTLSGGGGPDTVNGGDGDDRLEGGGGDDDVNGDPGKDQLSGGPGNDHCLGGPDPDSITGCEHGHP